MISNDWKQQWMTEEKRFQKRIADLCYEGTDCPTPPALVIEMISHIEEKQSSSNNPYSCVDFTCGWGTFLRAFFKMLQVNFPNVEKIELFRSCVYGSDIDKHKIKVVQNYFVRQLSMNNDLDKAIIQEIVESNIVCADALKETNLLLKKWNTMKFDVVVGNPPYNEDSESDKHATKQKGSKNLWIEFFELAKTLLKDNSYICFVTPNHWIRNTNKVKETMTNGSFLWAEISDIKKHFPKVGSTFTAWIWSPTPGELNIFCNGNKIDINQNLIPSIAEPTLDDWQFLKNDFGRRPVNWQRANKTDNMKMPCIVVERASPMKRIYSWNGIETPRGDWYFYNCSNQDELNDIIDFLRSNDGQRIIMLIRSGTAITHAINKIPCLKNE